MKIYVAASWRTVFQPDLVMMLRAMGHEVYDFKNPEPGNTGFSWSEIDPNWKTWTPAEYRAALQHPLAIKGYGFDISALRWCDACVLVLPSGRSASWELGFAMGLGKKGYVFQSEGFEPELMYREAKFIVNVKEMFEEFGPAPEEASHE